MLYIGLKYLLTHTSYSWLDNSGSWDELAPLLAKAGYYFVALDPPGCGKSEHLPPSSWYIHFREEAVMLMHCGDALGWKDPFILCAHSRGTQVVNVCGAVFPHRINAVLCIEATLALTGCWFTCYGPPLFENPEGSFEDFYAEDERNRSRKPRRFETLEEAIIHNEKNPNFPKSRATAEGIVRQHITKTSDGKYTFLHDTRIYSGVSFVSLFPEANRAMQRSIQCPFLVLCVPGSFVSKLHDFDSFVEAVRLRHGYKGLGENLRPFYEDVCSYFKSIDNCTIQVIPGLHHVHSDNPDLVAKYLCEFLNNQASNMYRRPVPINAFAVDSARRKKMYLLPDDQKVEVRFSNESSLFYLPKCKDLVLEILGHDIWIRQWGKRKASKRILAIPDYQDNAASFDRLGNLIENDSSDDVCLVTVRH